MLGCFGHCFFVHAIKLMLLFQKLNFANIFLLKLVPRALELYKVKHVC